MDDHTKISDVTSRIYRHNRKVGTALSEVGGYLLISDNADLRDLLGDVLKLAEKIARSLEEDAQFSRDAREITPGYYRTTTGHVFRVLMKDGTMVPSILYWRFGDVRFRHCPSAREDVRSGVRVGDITDPVDPSWPANFN